MKFKEHFILTTIFAIIISLNGFMAAYASSGFDGTGTHISFYFLLSGNESSAHHIAFTITPADGYITISLIYLIMYGHITATMIQHKKLMSKIRHPQAA